MRVTSPWFHWPPWWHVTCLHASTPVLSSGAGLVLWFSFPYPHPQLPAILLCITVPGPLNHAHNNPDRSGVKFERKAHMRYRKPSLKRVLKGPYYSNVNIIESDLVCHELSKLSGWISSFDLSGHGNVNLHIILPLKEVRKHWIGNAF